MCNKLVNLTIVESTTGFLWTVYPHGEFDRSLVLRCSRWVGGRGRFVRCWSWGRAIVRVRWGNNGNFLLNLLLLGWGNVLWGRIAWSGRGFRIISCSWSGLTLLIVIVRRALWVPWGRVALGSRVSVKWWKYSRRWWSISIRLELWVERVAVLGVKYGVLERIITTKLGRRGGAVLWLLSFRISLGRWVRIGGWTGFLLEESWFYI